ncbi:MAG: hypothetical protein IIB89_07480 [Chloroflexi bacterium]|nr:hypothetical protein [Chloroflexota bacterium]
MPAGCGPTISCGGLAEGACCVDGECIPETQTECDDDGGVFHTGLTCEQIACNPELVQVGCRDERMPSYDPGDKAHSLDLCETVVLAAVRHRSIGGADLGSGVQPGYVTPVTAHEVRAIKTGTDDPCRFYVGKFVKDHDGYIRPFLCSNPEGGGVSGGRYNVGFGFKQRIRDVEHGGRRLGYMYRAVGVEPPRWNEIVYRDNPVLCRGPKE